MLAAGQTDDRDEMAGTPHSAEQVTCGWLTEVLRDAGMLGPSGWVADLALRPLGAGFGQTSDTTRIELVLGGDAEPGTPRSLVAKFATTEAARRKASVSAQLYRREVGFYEDVATHVTTRSPRCYFARTDADGEFFALLLEDFPDHRPGDETLGCPPADAELAIGQLARLHGPFWGRPDAAGCQPAAILPMDRVQRAWPVMVDTFGEYLPDEIRGAEDKFLASVPALHDWVSGAPCTAVHGDFRLDNLLFGQPGTPEEIVVLDWQAVRAARGIQDFAYLVSHSMTTADRRTSEEHLLRTYVAGLSRFDVRYDLDEARLDYTRAMLYLFSIVLWITGVNVNTHERALRRKRALVQRACAALLDSDALALLPFH